MGAAENRQIVTDVYMAFGQGDIGGVIDSLTDDVVCTNHSVQTNPTSGVFRGKDGVQKFLGLVNEALDISKLDVRTMIAEDDVVVVLLDYAATVRSNGKTFEGPLVHWFTLRDGKLATFDEFEHETHDGWT